MSGDVEIKGDVGASIKAEAGAIVNIQVMASSPDSSEEIHKHAVHLLLKSCDAIDRRKAVERISYRLFGESFFKNLSLSDLEKLQLIVNEMAAIANRQPNYSVGARTADWFKRLAMALPFF